MKGEKAIKVLILGDANSSHIIKWVTSLSMEGIIVGLWTMNASASNIYDSSITLHHAGNKQSRSSLKAKLLYLTALSDLKQFIKDFEPDIVHAHYASSYGLLGALSGFNPFIISVWGSDVYDFPIKNLIFKQIIRFNLRRADKILSTSHVMAIETNKYTSKAITVTPFGIDLDVFTVEKNNNIEKEYFTIGTVKAMEKKYGIDYLLKAFALLRNKYREGKFKLLIVGGGSQLDNLKRLANSMNIYEDCIFTGPVPFSQVCEYHNKIDISVYLSIMDSESFGVSAVEASAASKPVVVSNVGGLPEVIEDGITGIVVQPKDIDGAFKAIERIYLDANLAKDLGDNGRKRVENFYDWKKNVKQMLGIYEELS